MPRLTDATKQARRERIITAAMECFAEKGFANTSMADIIDAAGLSAGSIYSHFEGKTELIRSVAEEALFSREGLESVGPDGVEFTPGRMFGTYFRDVLTRDRARILLQVWSESAQDAGLAEFVQTFIGHARSLLTPSFERGIAAQSGLSGRDLDRAVDRAFNATVAFAQGGVVRVALDQSVEPRELVDQFESLLEQIDWTA